MCYNSVNYSASAYPFYQFSSFEFQEVKLPWLHRQGWVAPQPKPKTIPGFKDTLQRKPLTTYERFPQATAGMCVSQW